jgi:tRNA A-37 threonylcarbamoyl transferase component Bud32
MPGTPDPALLDQLRAALDSSYDIEREIGGGMSRVFAATERALGRRVVIKVLPPELTAGVNRDRFRREIQFAARLQHPHIVPLLTAGQAGDILYYTMPLVEGETLRARLDREGRLEAGGVVSILQDVVDALAYAHGQGLVHRDIKPENILLQRNHALITDFGVAKAISDALPGSAATTVGVAVGTPAYMAPEQLAADPAADHRIDLYAIGLLAYELLSGSSPFKGSSPQQTLARQMTERPTPPHIQRGDVPSALSAIVMRCLEKDPSARWSSADDLLKVLGDLRITGSGMRSITRTRRIDAVRPAGRRGILIGGLVIVGTLAAAGAYARWGKTAAVVASAPRDTAIPPSPAAVPAATALTRADSEAIAAAVARRLTQRKAAPVVALSQKEFDSIRIDVERSVTDSVIKMLATNRRGFHPESIRVGPGIVPIVPGIGMPGPLIGDLRRGTTRVVVKDVADASPDGSLGDLAKTLTDSLGRILGRRDSTRIFVGDRVREAGRGFSDPHSLGIKMSADAVVEGSLESRGNNVQLVVVLHAVRDERLDRSFRRSGPRATAPVLAAGVASDIVGWLDGHRIAEGPLRVNLDSILQQTRRLRDSLRKRPAARPDSSPDQPTA